MQLKNSIYKFLFELILVLTPFIIGAIGYVFTNIVSMGAEVKHVKERSDAVIRRIDKRLDRIENKIDRIKK